TVRHSHPVGVRTTVRTPLSAAARRRHRHVAPAVSGTRCRSRTVATARPRGTRLSIARLRGLAAVAIPKRVVFGAADDVFSADTPAQTAARIGAPAPTLIPAGRHLTMISDPGRVAAAFAALTGT